METVKRPPSPGDWDKSPSFGQHASAAGDHEKTSPQVSPAADAFPGDAGSADDACVWAKHTDAPSSQLDFPPTFGDGGETPEPPPSPFASSPTKTPPITDLYATLTDDEFYDLQWEEILAYSRKLEESGERKIEDWSNVSPWPDSAAEKSALAMLQLMDKSNPLGGTQLADRPSGATGGVRVPTDDLEKLTLDGDKGKGGKRERKSSFHRYQNPHTKPTRITNKKGKVGKEETLLCNFFKMKYKSDYTLHQYHVDFAPPVASKFVRKAMFHEFGVRQLGVHTFDGMVAFSITKLKKEVTEWFCVRKFDNVRITMTIKRGKEVPKNTVEILHVFNLLMKQTLKAMGLDEVNRNYYNRRLATKLDDFHLEFWPGYSTSILQYEQDILLNVNVKHRAMRTDCALEIMNQIRKETGDSRYQKSNIRDALVGQTIMTLYNEKMYRIHDIDWSLSPRSTFRQNVKAGGYTYVTYEKYFKETHNRRIQDLTQPLFVHKVVKGDGEKVIHLLPELCQMTGLTDKMTKDWNVMSKVSEKTRLNPHERVRRLKEFRRCVDQAESQPFKNFELEVDSNLLTVTGRVLPPEQIFLAPDKSVQMANDSQWTKDLFTNQATSATIRAWYFIYHHEDRQVAHQLENTMREIGQAMKIYFPNTNKIPISGRRHQDFTNAMAELPNIPNKLVLVLLPSNQSALYDKIKQEAYTSENSHINQCVNAKKLANTQRRHDNYRSVVTKIVIQINCKLGGEGWRVHLNVGSVMITGMDTYHDAQKGKSVAAFVASLNRWATSYCSYTTHQETGLEYATNLQPQVYDALKRYQAMNGKLPAVVVAYRDGVGEGQLEDVRDFEVSQYMKAFEQIPRYRPAFIFIVVTKRISPRFFVSYNSKTSNPVAGTVVDEVVTRPESYDFYLISQSVRQGTVTPVRYNVLTDTSGATPDNLQQLSYKLCHLYYNWSGTIRCPAPCQYAHKLAYVTGTALHRQHSDTIRNNLFYL